MTRYEKFIESINTPEKLIQKAHEFECNSLIDILDRGCPGNCNDDEYIVEHCNKCYLNYLNEEINKKNMHKDNNKLGIEFPKQSDFPCCTCVQISIDRERVNAVGLYPINKDERRIEDLENLDFEVDTYELEVRNIEDIALLMNEETFDRFCNLWKEYHGQQ